MLHHQGRTKATLGGMLHHLRSLNEGIKAQISEFWPTKMLLLHHYQQGPEQERFRDPYVTAKNNPRKELSKLREQEGGESVGTKLSESGTMCLYTNLISHPSQIRWNQT